jgi:hypothetical protein
MDIINISISDIMTRHRPRRLTPVLPLPGRVREGGALAGVAGLHIRLFTDEISHNLQAKGIRLALDVLS